MSRGAENQSRRISRRLGLGALIVVVLALTALGVGSWIGSSELVDPHHYHVEFHTRVLAVRSGRVTLARDEHSTQPGIYGLSFAGGHAILGRIIHRGGTSVTRRVGSMTGHLSPGQKVGIDQNVWETNPQLARGIPFQDVAIPDPLGPMPAWLVTGSRRTWVIYVHGLAGSRAAGLRDLGALHLAGFPTLLISLRTDLGAPADPDGHVHLGMTEWEDLDAAAHYAVAHGAQHLALIGESMGGAIVTRFLHLSKLARLVRALVLDAPVLDWRTVIHYVVSRRHLWFAAKPLEWAVAQRIHIDWDALDELRQTRGLHLPILVFQGLDDQLVPPSESAAFARALPGFVTYVPVPRAGHVASWNLNPAAYEKRLSEFLTANGD